MGVALRSTGWAVLRGLGVLWAVFTVLFLLFSALPADPVRSRVGVNVSEEAVNLLRQELGYGDPLLRRYWSQLRGLAHLDLGISLTTREPVLPRVAASYVITLGYVTGAMALSALGSLVLLGIGYFGGQTARSVVLWVCRTITSLPGLIIAIFLGLALITSGALTTIPSFVLRGTLMVMVALAVHPMLSLAEIGITQSWREAKQGYSIAGRSFGFSGTRLFWFYVAKGTLLPWGVYISNLAASLVGGSVVMEAVFSLPGTGSLLLRAVVGNDFPLMQGIVLVTVSGFLLLHEASHWTLARLYPRVR